MWILGLALISSLLVAGLVAPVVIGWYKGNKWLEQPDKNVKLAKFKKTHGEIVPRGGGIVVGMAILVVSAIFLKLDIQIIMILVGAMILMIVGWLDDVYNVHPLIRLGTNVLVAAGVVWSGVTVKFVTNPFGDGVAEIWEWGNWWQILSMAGVVVFIVWNINIVNWAKGVDGQMPGFVMIASFFIGLLSLRFWNDPNQAVQNTTILSMIVAGAFGGFLWWNFYPQKMMPGYGGGALGGYFLSVVAILSGAKVATMLMVLAIPTADAMFTIMRRIRAGKSPFWGDRGHLHHKLLDNLGWSKRQIAFFYWGVALLMGLLSLILDTAGKIIALVIAISLTFIFLIGVKIKTKISSNR
jgi:UDP-GlcNAc:undecaprenyl-phosphate GlcNAc-1-phosphate transferase